MQKKFCISFDLILTSIFLLYTKELVKTSDCSLYVNIPKSVLNLHYLKVIT